MLLAPKKDRSYKPTVDVWELNKSIRWEHFEMEAIHLVKDLLQKGEWLVKLDLKYVYFSVPIHQEYAGRGRLIYQFNCLPFGLSSGPRVFTKIMFPVIAWLGQLYRLSNNHLHTCR